MKKLAAIFVLCASASIAAAFPDKPVHIVVSNPPGGPVDVMLRVLSQRLAELWKQPVIVENKPGGSGIVSTTAIVRSEPDGHTLGMVVASAVTIMPFSVDRLPYDPVKDLQPISLVARTPFVFVVPQSSPIKDWQSFISLAKTKDLNVGSLSIGTAFHLVWEQTARRAGIKALYVPSPSSGKTQTDLLGGRLDVVLDAPSSAKGMLDGGKLRALAVTSAERFSGLPDTPTLSESGLKDYSATPWIGLMGPIGIPADRVRQIEQDVRKVLQEPAMKARMESLGMIPVGSSPEELADTIRQDRKEMEPLVKQLGIRLQ
ncbi:tripartite tricarboxylate transporter substrate binding protein [Burkholderiales bacterium]